MSGQRGLYRRSLASAVTYSVVASLAVLCAAQEKSKLRTWQDTTGTYRIDAELLRATDQAVLLRRADGAEITVPLDRLSQADRDFLSAPKTAPAVSAAGRVVTSATDQIVFATWHRGGVAYSLPGLVLHRKGDLAYIVTPTVKDNVAPVSEQCLLSWNLKSGRRDTEGQRLATVQRANHWVFAGPASELPPPLPTSNPAVLQEETPVHVAGYTLALGSVTPMFAKAQAEGVVRQLVRDEQGQLTEIRIGGDQVSGIHLGIVVAGDGQLVCCLLPAGTSMPRERKLDEIIATPFEALQSLRRPQLEVVDVAVVGGDRNELEYEFVAYVTDPFAEVHGPRLLVQAATTSAGTSERVPVTRQDRALADAVELRLASQPPSDMASDQMTARASRAARLSFVARHRTTNPGPLEVHRFQMQLAYSDAEGKPRYSAPAWSAFRPSQIAALLKSRGKTLPAIPGLDGLPLDMPRQQQHPGGGFLITGAWSRVADPKMPLEREFPAPREIGQSVAGKRDSGEVADVVALTLRLSANTPGFGRRPLAMFSADGDWLYVVDGQNVLHKIHADTLTDELALDLGTPIADMCLSKAGLVISLTRQSAVWVIDPVSLRVLREFPIPGAHLVAGSPGSHLSFVLAGTPPESSDVSDGWTLWMLDIENGRPLHVVKSRFNVGGAHRGVVLGSYRLLADKYVSMQMTANGKHLLLGGYAAERFRVNGEDLVFDTLSEPAPDRQVTLTLSRDGKRLIVPGGYGPDAKPGIAVYEVSDLSQRAMFVKLTVLAGAAGALDPETGEIYASQVGHIGVFNGEGTKLRMLPGSVAGLQQIIVHPRGKRLLAVGSYQAVMYVLK